MSWACRVGRSALLAHSLSELMNCYSWAFHRRRCWILANFETDRHPCSFLYYCRWEADGAWRRFIMMPQDIISSETWSIWSDETWQTNEVSCQRLSLNIFGSVALGAAPKRTENNYYSVSYTTHCFGQFALADFHQTWHEHVNPCPDESYRSRILEFFR